VYYPVLWIASVVTVMVMSIMIMSTHMLLVKLLINITDTSSYLLVLVLLHLDKCVRSYGTFSIWERERDKGQEWEPDQRSYGVPCLIRSTHMLNHH
jgi:hypothetical protein